TPVADPTIKSQRPRSRALRFLRKHLADAWSVGDRLPTETELAGHLGVSRGTVRAALKQLEDEGLLTATRGTGRVVQARPVIQQDIPRTPHLTAAGAMMRQSVVFARVPKQPVANNGFVVERAIFDAFAHRGNPVVAIDLNRADDEDIEQLIAGKPLGLIAPHAVAEDEGCRAKLRKVASAGITVTVQGDGPELAGFQRVISDHRLGIKMLVDHLRERGIRRPAQVRSLGRGAPQTYWSTQRYAGFLEEAADLDARVVEDDPHTFGGGFDVPDQTRFDHYVRLMAGLLVEQLTGPEPADALLFDTDFACFYGAAAVRRFGLVPNRDVLLVGYDDYWTLSPLRRYESAHVDATINKNEAAAGEALADLLLRAEPISNQDRPHVRPPKLVVGPHVNSDADAA
ncbi:MAG: GntR family transcriptional regulator, partial [Planctomycetota bacterium]